MYYYGTSLTEHGHYFWTIKENSLEIDWLINNYENLPFNPEKLPMNTDKRNQKGMVGFYNMNGYSILEIVGSCVDKRGNTESVFFLEETLTLDEMRVKIFDIPIAQKIIAQMPFDVMWPETKIESKIKWVGKDEDTIRLDVIQKAATGYGNGFVLRYSENGRGLRLHETTQEGACEDVRTAIDNFLVNSGLTVKPPNIDCAEAKPDLLDLLATLRRENPSMEVI